MIESVEKFLPLVTKPARYIGGEVNTVLKPWGAATVHVLLAFPEVYEIGMSHLGLKILYHVVNSHDSYLAERVFAPWTDMEGQMRDHGIPLYSLESYRPVCDFDILGFSLQYEMTFTNVLNMLDLGGIPILSEERKDSDPIVIAGGPCALNPEPMSAFIDAFVVGEAEEAILELLETFEELRKEGGTRREVLKKWSEIEGVYVPSLYERVYEGDRFKSIVPQNDAPACVSRRWVRDLEKAAFSTAPPVSFVEAVHDRFTVEIMRGCTRGCRFCHAGMKYRPVRERSVETICRLVDEGLRNTGYDGITLASLSSTDYSGIKQLLDQLTVRLAEKRVSISLPSLRLDSFSLGLADRVQQVRKSGFTFAPEAATDRLRRVINKGYTEDEMFSSLENALLAGWDVFKLYFMVGLPTETEEDILAIARLIEEIRRMGRRIRGKRFRTNVSLSAFVPKPHTPFQWENIVDEKALDEKYRFITSRLPYRDVGISWRDPILCLLEGLLARGDWRLGDLIFKAWQGGTRFDGWSSEFNVDAWKQAMSECGVTFSRVTHFDYETGDGLPWDHIDTGVKKSYLVAELERSRTAEFTADCREGCVDCGVCAHVDLSD